MHITLDKHIYASCCIFLHGYLLLMLVYTQIYAYIGAFWLAFGPVLHHLGSLEMTFGLLDKLLNVLYEANSSRPPTLMPNNCINR